MDRGDESIPSFRYGFDVCLRGTLPEGLPQHRNTAVEIAFVDKRVWPELLQQMAFFNQVSRVFNEDAQELEDLRRERHRTAIAKQPVLRQIQTKVTEFVDSI